MKKKIAVLIGIAVGLCIALTACIRPGGSIGTNQDPVANFTVQTGSQTLNVVFHGSSSIDPDGEIVLWEWYFGDGDEGSGKTVAHTYMGPGVYPVLLRVQDNDGAHDEITKDVTVVAPEPIVTYPVARFFWSPRGSAVQTGTKVTFDARRSSGSIEWAWWNFGNWCTWDGPWTDWEQDCFGEWKEVPGMSVMTYIYFFPGEYTVTLKIIDKGGRTALTSRRIKVY